MAGDELRLLKRYLKIRTSILPWLFLSERKLPMTRQNINASLQSAATRAGIGEVNPRMLRHSCGFYLANKGCDFRLIQDYLGHRDPKHTVRYTRVASVRFEGLF
jgi:type 1 fimbriae regulatory protein FimB